MVRIFALFLTFPALAGNFVVSGKVTDSISEKPLAKVDLAIRSPQGTQHLRTNGNGEYRHILKNVTEGNLTVTASRTGVYRPITSRIVNIQKGSYEVINMEMKYETWARVEGDDTSIEPVRAPANAPTNSRPRMRQICLGDLSGDYFVDGEDLVIWQRNNGIKGKLVPTDGDLNGDNQVDNEDYAMMQPAFGTRYDAQCNVVRSPKIVEWILPKN